jgi:copper transport protein
VAALTTVVAGAALAHATLVRSDPAAGSRVTVAPSALRLEFNEAVSARTSRIELVAPDSQRLSLEIRGDSTNAKVLLADVPLLTSRGQYRVDWRLVGPDGHAVSGRFSFNFDSTAVADTAVPPSAAPSGSNQPTTTASNATLFGALRFLSTLTTTLLIGATAFMLLVLPRVRSARTSIGAYDAVVQERVRIVAWLSVAALLPVFVVRLISQESALAGSFGAIHSSDLLTIVAETPWGRAWAMVVVAATSALVMLRRPRSRTRRTPWVGLAIVCLAVAVAAPFLGHPAAAGGAAIPLDAVHVLAAGGWAGTIMIIGVAALPVTLRAQLDDRVLMIKSLLGAFTPIALSCATLLMITGTGEALLQLGQVSALWQTPYGLALVRKLVLVMGVLLLGAWHWRVAQGTMARARSITALRWSMLLDVAVVVGVIALTAILTGTPLPTE